MLRTDEPEGQHDPHQWLEALDDERALAWVAAENAKTLDVLERDERFARFRAEALAIYGSTDRIPAPAFLTGDVFNFWQDAHHERGIWRRASLASYRSAEPAWTTVLDLDALSAGDGVPWVWHGGVVSPDESRCMLALSAGGEDASTLREFDLAHARFVEGGFALPRGKQTAAWLNDDALLVAREWTPGEVTASGYPFVVKRLDRSRPVDDAVDVFRGSASDMGVWPREVRDGTGRRIVLVERRVAFFEAETYVYDERGARRLGIPLEASVEGMVAGRLVVKLEQPWDVAGTTFPAGAVVSVDADAALADPEHLVPVLVYAPGPRETLDQLDTTRDRLVAVVYENVKGRAFVYAPEPGGGWSCVRLPLPDEATLALGATNPDGDEAFVYATGFLAPTTLFLADVRAATAEPVKALPSQFDTSDLVVEQHEVASADGTPVPYFIVRPRAMPFDGTTPTILYAYGGFRNAVTPAYNGALGKIWLERGGAFAIANIRGGGEFGPAWHRAGLKSGRRLVYEDFVAVARDLVARGITSPRRLGIQGGSNGGLLVGVMMTQHPDLWNAVAIQVPLLDMLRFEYIAAGPSWTAEYGSISVPEERAFLASISPYHRLEPGVRYPLPLVWTTTKDDRVGPQHARKFAARLAELGAPYYFFEMTEGGHGAGSTIDERAFTMALELTYFAQRLMDA